MKTTQAYRNAISEAERFIERARVALKHLEETDQIYFPFADPKTSAAKRSSMDLTRSLAVLRQPHKYDDPND